MNLLAPIVLVADETGALSDIDGLSAFDTNANGVLSAADDSFTSFMLWTDSDGGGVASAFELSGLIPELPRLAWTEWRPSMTGVQAKTSWSMAESSCDSTDRQERLPMLPSAMTQLPKDIWGAIWVAMRSYRASS